MQYDLAQAVVRLALVVSLSLTAILLRALDGRGFLASVAVGYAIISGGGLGWFIVVGVFFALGVGFTWYKYEYKKGIGAAEEKQGARNWPNILANGGAASLFSLGELFYQGPVFAALFLGSMAAVASDTVATEVGLLSRSTPRLLTRPNQPVAPGTSGGVTPLGLVGAFFASLVIGTIAALLGILPGVLLPLSTAIIGGIAGSVSDSLYGATIQRKGFCIICGKPVERITHCGEATKRTGGSRFVENNMVNLMGSVSGSLASLLVLLVLYDH